MEFASGTWTAVARNTFIIFSLAALLGICFDDVSPQVSTMRAHAGPVRGTNKNICHSLTHWAHDYLLGGMDGRRLDWELHLVGSSRVWPMEALNNRRPKAWDIFGKASKAQITGNLRWCPFLISSSPLSIPIILIGGLLIVNLVPRIGT